MKKILKKIKNIIYKVFGKARWYLVILLVTTLITFLPSFFTRLNAYLEGVKTPEDGLINEISLGSIDSFSINNEGRAVVYSWNDKVSYASGFDLDSGKNYFSNGGYVSDSSGDDSLFYPYNFAITDDNTIYAVRYALSNDQSKIYSKESIIRLSSDYKYLGTVFDIDYDQSKKQRSTKISKLNYYDGEVTFAEVERDGVWLYKIDTKDQSLTKSDFYPTDENGTYTVSVIPVDDAFIFLRSDGNVYKVGFGEKFGDSIYRYDLSEEGETDSPLFDRAVLVDGKLYVADSNNDSTVYSLDNGILTKEFDPKEIPGKEDSKLLFLDSYREDGSSNDSLIVCFNDGIMTYKDGKFTDKDITIKFNPTLLMYLYKLNELLNELSLAALVINIIIRKKTLLYKQLMLTLPVVIAVSLIIAWQVFVRADEQNSRRVKNDLATICDLTTSKFDGYDFSDLLEVNENTGGAYQELMDKLESIDSKDENDWSKNYIFAIIYRNELEDEVLLATDDSMRMPLYRRRKAKFVDTKDKSKDIIIEDTVTSVFEDVNLNSKISAYGRITDKDGTGRFYMVVTTSRSSLFVQRTDILFSIIEYGLIIIGTLVVLITITFLFIARTIKSATKTVRKISEGNLSARIKYRSKDELGEICSEVNEMGQSLETLFKEKDETEQFYYKFVPEKFRELLGKENFTDLSLGDAKNSELTVLFCDIRSFSINSEMMTAKENFAFVNVIYGKMGPIIRENNGFVDKYIGDAVMALFENADDAVKCGIELYRAVVLDPETSKELGVSDINIGIGIHTGMAMIGIVGESERLAGTVISETVNLSSRLESLTKQYKTAMLISKDTVDRMTDPDALDMRYLGMVQVAGVNEVKAIYEVLDCLPDDEKEKRSQSSEEFKEAIRLFLLGRRSDAASALQSIEKAGKNDYVTDKYLEYISEMSDDDKSNVFRFVRK